MHFRLLGRSGRGVIVPEYSYGSLNEEPGSLDLLACLTGSIVTLMDIHRRRRDGSSRRS